MPTIHMCHHGMILTLHFINTVKLNQWDLGYPIKMLIYEARQSIQRFLINDFTKGENEQKQIENKGIYKDFSKA